MNIPTFLTLVAMVVVFALVFPWVYPIIHMTYVRYIDWVYDVWNS